ncbi:MAG: tRNA-2-methylthio-N6-dimethylallyladenosine synthase [Sphingobacteriales bacterium]|jgi:tRNA-2-methylthio-N6-dimethylallyladenosine synthase
MFEESKLVEESRQGEALLMEKKGASAETRKVYIETYGCQMNFSDSEIVASILQENDFETVADPLNADLVFINTCSIRENAEQKARQRLRSFKEAKKDNPKMIIGVLGCMAERLKSKFLEEEKLVDIVVGPDAYRDLPKLIEQVDGGHKAVNVLLSREETYADISPVRLGSNGVSAFVSIMRGCDNMCSFCVVPFTRGRERSRDPKSIVQEIKELSEKGFKEITLLGQNVDSFKFANEDGAIINFAELLHMSALVDSTMRIRFSTSHPKDITDEVIETIAAHDNICNYIHLPVQSGSSSVLKRMNRTYTREWYINRIDAIRRIIPNCGISTDMISGFCGETDQDQEETLSLMDYVKFDFAYMYKYSERPGTLAAKKYEDDVVEAVKQARLAAIIRKQQQHAFEQLKQHVNKVHTVLIEGNSKKSDQDFCGRNDQNAMMVFPKKPGVKVGDYVKVLGKDCTTATLLGEIVE